MSVNFKMSHRHGTTVQSGQSYLGNDVSQQWAKDHEVLPGIAKKYIQ